MLFDTDVLIWIQNGNEKAANLVANDNLKFISIQTYMELFQCARSKKSIKLYAIFYKKWNLLSYR